MSAQDAPTRDVDGKHAVDQLERVETHDEGVMKIQPTYEKVDEFGAHSKTDPREIALVKKLDLYILV